MSDGIHGVARHGPRPLAPLRDDTAYQVRILLELLRPLGDAGHLLDDFLDERRLAFQAADSGGAAALLYPLLGLGCRIYFVQIPNRTFIGIAGIGAAHARRIGLHGLELFDDRVRILAQPDRVAVGLGHLASIEPRHLRRRGQQRFGLRQNRDSRAFEKSQQPVAIRHGEPRIRLHQRLRFGERIGIAFFLERLAQRAVHGGISRAQALDGLFHLLLEFGFAAIDVIEAPRDFARDLDVRDLIFAHRHVLRAIQQNVRALQQRIAEKSIGAQVMVGELRLLILVGRNALQPAQAA